MDELHSTTDPDAYHLSGNELKSIEKWRKRYSRGCVLVSNHYDGLALNSSKPLKLKAIPYKADISLIGMEEIHGPIFGFFPVIAKWPGKLELQGPLVWD